MRKIRKGAINTPCEKMIATINTKCFIQPAIAKEHMMHHEGYTHKLLDIPVDYNLRHAKTLLKDIVKTPIGGIVMNPLEIGKPMYKVTTELKRHANFSLNLLKITESRMKKNK